MFSSAPRLMHTNLTQLCLPDSQLDEDLGRSVSILLLFDCLGFLLNLVNKKSKSFLGAKSISELPHSALPGSPHITYLRLVHAVGLACSSKYFDFIFIQTKAVHVESCDVSDYAGPAWLTCFHLSWNTPAWDPCAITVSSRLHCHLGLEHLAGSERSGTLTGLATHETLWGHSFTPSIFTAMLRTSGGFPGMKPCSRHCLWLWVGVLSELHSLKRWEQ